jgi:4-hydroxyproline epimerase
MNGMRKILAVDSHTGGEPTRVIVEGGPELGGGTMAERRDIFRERFDHFRRATVCEPRGNDVMVGALVCEPSDPECAAGVIFFNNVGYLGMCGHGTIGLVSTLAYLGRITMPASGPARLKIETPVGIVNAMLHRDGRVSVKNVPSYRKAKAVSITVPGIGVVTGDVAYGGNWFFLMYDYPGEISLAQAGRLTEYSERIRRAVNEIYPEVDHVELFGPPSHPDAADSKNFVLCPGGAYDRSPCGTGTSAKLACLCSDGKFAPFDTYRQESVTGSVFEGRVEIEDDVIFPIITGSAFINSEATLILNSDDPLCWGMP